MSTGFTDEQEQELLKLVNKTNLLFFLFGVSRSLVLFVVLFCLFFFSPVLSVGCKLHGFRCGVRQNKGFKLGFIVSVSMNVCRWTSRRRQPASFFVLFVFLAFKEILPPPIMSAILSGFTSVTQQRKPVNVRG